MNTKHNPVTPLPWKAVRQSVLTQHGEDVAAVAVPLVSMGSTIGDSLQNAQYIAHAANAYPRLIECIKGFMEDNPGVYNGESLLRELGEL